MFFDYSKIFLFASIAALQRCLKNRESKKRNKKNSRGVHPLKAELKHATQQMRQSVNCLQILIHISLFNFHLKCLCAARLSIAFEIYKIVDSPMNRTHGFVSPLLTNTKLFQLMMRSVLLQQAFFTNTFLLQ